MIEQEAQPVLRLDRVGVVFGTGPRRVEALHEVSLVVRPGELVAVTGRSGSGKSSLLNVAGGLVPAASGQVVVGGEYVTGSTARDQATIRRRHIGYVFQDLNLLPSLTAVENVSLPLELAGHPRRESEVEAREVLERVGLAGLEERHPDELSGGQRQRVAVARGLVGRRSLLLADEPTSALDDLTGEEIMTLIRQECDRGAAALLVTHEPSLAGWADRVIRLRARPGPGPSKAGESGNAGKAGESSKAGEWTGSIESEAIRPARRPDLAELSAFSEPTP